jgi:hypothetical protein
MMSGLKRMNACKLIKLIRRLSCKKRETNDGKNNPRSPAADPMSYDKHPGKINSFLAEYRRTIPKTLQKSIGGKKSARP